MRNTRYILVGAVTLISALVFTTTLVRAFFIPNGEIELPKAVEARAPSAVVENTERPARLRVPSIAIDARVEDVGITKTGNMAVPKSFSEVGWYRYGPVPGQKGSAVFAGHVDNAIALPGVFKKLGEIKIGDEIVVETEGGKALRFVVEEKQTYPYDQVPAERLFNRADTARLNLVTCGGAWIQSEKTYDERVVVYARLAPPR